MPNTTVYIVSKSGLYLGPNRQNADIVRWVADPMDAFIYSRLGAIRMAEEVSGHAHMFTVETRKLRNVRTR